MNVSLKPELERFVDDQVKAGRFPSPIDVIEAGLARLMNDGMDELDDETLAAINEGEAQYERGQGLPWEDVRKELRSKYLKKQ